ncbi:hypothetical protein J2X36_002106 [Methylobacterium sp. BE186]|uniref:hypothetical protein n=1 Tax=Methylobacterium sp. BE186 TaxID=2817715 RepID=UPI00286204DF|nr:hypothetical protein [Methylobacterium sp. BE186]MDR7037359.1 hypothetical protein [Methylobacterium sp. BE186]
MRVAMGGRPRHHDVETICQWLRHVAAPRDGSAEGGETEGLDPKDESAVPATSGQAPVGIPMLVKDAQGYHALGEDGTRFNLAQAPEPPRTGTEGGGA